MVTAATVITEDDRILSLRQDVWIGYERAVQVRDQLDMLLRFPRTHRMPNCAVIGETNNGKTMLLKNFCKRHNPPDDPNAEKTVLPALMIQTPPEPDEGRLYYALLQRLCAERSAREAVDSKFARLKLILQHLETQMLIFDEFAHALAGSDKKLRRFLNSLKYLGNELQMPIVVSGTPEVLNALSSDPQLANRFKPAFLPKWTADRMVEFARFVVSIEPRLGLKETSNLMTTDALNGLLRYSEGLLGEVVELLRVLAQEAIKSGAERIEESMIEQKTLKRLGWVVPSERTRYVM